MKILIILFLSLSANAAKIKIGQSFPSVVLKDFSESKKLNPFEVSKNNKITIIDFWASWCGPCMLSMPVLSELYQTYKDKGLLVIGVNVDNEIEKGQAFATKMKLKFPILYDGKRELIKKIEITTMPTTYLLNGQG